MNRDEILKALDEISNYFCGCRRNAVYGTKAREQFDEWIGSLDEAKKLVQDGDDVAEKAADTVRDEVGDTIAGIDFSNALNALDKLTGRGKK